MALPVLKSCAKAVGKQALASGIQFASDVTQGRDPREAFLDNAKKGVRTLSNKAADKIQFSKGVGSRSKSKKATITTKRKKNETVQLAKRSRHEQSVLSISLPTTLVQQ